MYDGAKKMMTEEAFDLWCENAVASADTPTIVKTLPTDCFKPKPAKVDVKQAVEQARQAVSGYATNNGARKAIEALAEAIEDQL